MFGLVFFIRMREVCLLLLKKSSRVMGRMKTVIVRYLSFSSVSNGVSGFYGYDHDQRCTQPGKRYKHGWCHTEGEELDELALRVGFMTREQFAQERRRQGKTSWKILMLQSCL